MDEFNNRKILSLEVGCLTDVGTLRQHNEDSFGFYQPNDPEILYEKGEMYLVANGFGGKGIGDIASRMVIDVVTKEYYNQPITLSVEESLSHAFQLANKRILETLRHQVSQLEAGSTATCAIIQRSNVCAAHVGNGRLYEIKGYTIKQLTQDHIAPSESEATIEKIRIGQPNYALTKILGHDEMLEPDMFTLKLRPGTHLLLCTDGLVNEIDNREIGRVVLKYSPQEACEQLIKAANARGSSDNLTVIIIKTKGLKALSIISQQSQASGINLMPQPEEKRESAFSSKTIRFSEPPVEPPTTPEASPVEEIREGQEPPADEASESGEKTEETPELQPLYYQESEKSAYQAPRGIQRRKIILPEDISKKIKINWFIVGYIVLGLIVASVIFYFLLENGPAIQKLFEKSESPSIIEKKPLEDQSQASDQKISAPFEERAEYLTSAEEIPEKSDTTIVITTTGSLSPLRILIVNGSMASASKISGFLNRLTAEKFEGVELSNQKSALKILSHSKIIYRPPFEESNIRIRGIAEKIRDIVSVEYHTKLEIVPCDLSITLGRDYDPKKVKLVNMKRFRQLTDQMPNMRAKRIEILNGSGVSGIANNLKRDLDFLILDDDKTYLQIIDARNAISMKHSKTTIKCLSFENEVAQNIARVLGLSDPPTRVINDDVDDVMVVLGKDFL